jgi:hypothetical protein
MKHVKVRCAAATNSPESVVEDLLSAAGYITTSMRRLAGIVAQLQPVRDREPGPVEIESE